MSTNAPDDLMTFHHAVMAECGFTDPNEVGIVGDPAHAARGGYHISGTDINATGKFGSDYSTSRGRDHFLPNPNASAVDIGDDWPRGGRAAWLRFNNALLHQMQASDPAVAAIRAINFSPDGTAKKRFDTGNRSAGVINSSDTVNIHTHLEWWRDTVGRRAASLARLLELIRAARDNTPLSGASTGDDMDAGEHQALMQTAQRVEALLKNRDSKTQTGTAGVFATETNLLAAAVADDGIVIDPATRDALAAACGQALKDALGAGGAFEARLTAWAQSAEGKAALVAAVNVAEDS